jgi:hypothetical protein
VSDDDTPASGSRWEPPADAEGANPTPAEPQRAPTGRRGVRVALAAAGAGLILAGGIGGFAIGHAAAGPGTEVSDSSTDTDEDGGPDGPRDGERGIPDFDGDDPGVPPGATLPDDGDPA